MTTFTDLADLVELVEQRGPELFVRWSKGPDADGVGCGEQSSRDTLTGVRLPGLSANPLRVEPWWGDRPLRLWVARRLYDYRHLRERRGPEVRPWLIEGEEVSRGPDNEPLVICHRPVGWIADEVLRECERLVDQANGADRWGPLDRER
ncbi:DUF6098 family protein [Saccharothrix coeruleofusca]|uniref:Uncharacterized protein n=1 Tax=Saccharothrix coeruleofusca TaxID=33919 RepID=A0A918ALU1_9PSEU|nr:DUF6098 family protein [Saccharothrix coeruleofusca]MBP2336240.1 hypothetical protein [Saccharothrix coeruleofusca]GGP54389.1 hypothetical protein GCM10010185_28610 [Saccharothrix coeruleofusca]